MAVVTYGGQRFATGGTANDPLYIVGNVGFVRGEGGTNNDGVFDVSTDPTSNAKTDAEAARNTFFNSNAETLERFRSNPAWVIELIYLVGGTETKTYQRYRLATNTWVDITSFVTGERGLQGFQSPYELLVFQNAARNTAPALPNDGTFDPVSKTWTTVPTGWTETPSVPGTGLVTWAAHATIDPATDTASFTPTFDFVAHYPNSFLTIDDVANSVLYSGTGVPDDQDAETGRSQIYFRQTDPVEVYFSTENEFTWSRVALGGGASILSGSTIPDNADANDAFSQLYLRTSTPSEIYYSLEGHSAWTQFTLPAGGTGTGVSVNTPQLLARVNTRFRVPALSDVTSLPHFLGFNPFRSYNGEEGVELCRVDFWNVGLDAAITDGDNIIYTSDEVGRLELDTLLAMVQELRHEHSIDSQIQVRLNRVYAQIVGSPNVSNIHLDYNASRSSAGSVPYIAASNREDHIEWAGYANNGDPMVYSTDSTAGTGHGAVFLATGLSWSTDDQNILIFRGRRNANGELRDGDDNIFPGVTFNDTHNLWNSQTYDAQAEAEFDSTQEFLFYAGYYVPSGQTNANWEVGFQGNVFNRFRSDNTDALAGGIHYSVQARDAFWSDAIISSNIPDNSLTNMHENIIGELGGDLVYGVLTKDASQASGSIVPVDALPDVEHAKHNTFYQRRNDHSLWYLTGAFETIGSIETQDFAARAGITWLDTAIAPPASDDAAAYYNRDDDTFYEKPAGALSTAGTITSRNIASTDFRSPYNYRGELSADPATGTDDDVYFNISGAGFFLIYQSGTWSTVSSPTSLFSTATTNHWLGLNGEAGSTNVNTDTEARQWFDDNSYVSTDTYHYYSAGATRVQVVTSYTLAVAYTATTVQAVSGNADAILLTSPTDTELEVIEYFNANPFVTGTIYYFYDNATQTILRIASHSATVPHSLEFVMIPNSDTIAAAGEGVPGTLTSASFVLRTSEASRQPGEIAFFTENNEDIIIIDNSAGHFPTDLLGRIPSDTFGTIKGASGHVWIAVINSITDQSSGGVEIRRFAFQRLRLSGNFADQETVRLGFQYGEFSIGDNSILPISLQADTEDEKDAMRTRIGIPEVYPRQEYTDVANFTLTSANSYDSSLAINQLLRDFRTQQGFEVVGAVAFDASRTGNDPTRLRVRLIDDSVDDVDRLEGEFEIGATRQTHYIAPALFDEDNILARFERISGGNIVIHSITFILRTLPELAEYSRGIQVGILPPAITNSAITFSWDAFQQLNLARPDTISFGDPDSWERVGNRWLLRDDTAQIRANPAVLTSNNPGLQLLSTVNITYDYIYLYLQKNDEPPVPIWGTDTDRILLAGQGTFASGSDFTTINQTLDFVEGDALSIIWDAVATDTSLNDDLRASLSRAVIGNVTIRFDAQPGAALAGMFFNVLTGFHTVDTEGDPYPFLSLLAAPLGNLKAYIDDGSWRFAYLFNTEASPTLQYQASDFSVNADNSLAIPSTLSETRTNAGDNIVIVAVSKDNLQIEVFPTIVAGQAPVTPATGDTWEFRSLFNTVASPTLQYPTSDFTWDGTNFTFPASLSETRTGVEDNIVIVALSSDDSTVYVFPTIVGGDVISADALTLKTLYRFSQNEPAAATASDIVGVADSSDFTVAPASHWQEHPYYLIPGGPHQGNWSLNAQNIEANRMAQHPTSGRYYIGDDTGINRHVYNYQLDGTFIRRQTLSADVANISGIAFEDERLFYVLDNTNNILHPFSPQTLSAEATGRISIPSQIGTNDVTWRGVIWQSPYFYLFGRTGTGNNTTQHLVVVDKNGNRQTNLEPSNVEWSNVEGVANNDTRIYVMDGAEVITVGYDGNGVISEYVTLDGLISASRFGLSLFRGQLSVLNRASRRVETYGERRESTYLENAWQEDILRFRDGTLEFGDVKQLSDGLNPQTSTEMYPGSQVRFTKTITFSDRTAATQLYFDEPHNIVNFIQESTDGLRPDYVEDILTTTHIRLSQNQTLWDGMITAVTAVASTNEVTLTIDWYEQAGTFTENEDIQVDMTFIGSLTVPAIEQIAAEAYPLFPPRISRHQYLGARDSLGSTSGVLFVRVHGEDIRLTITDRQSGADFFPGQFLYEAPSSRSASGNPDVPGVGFVDTPTFVATNPNGIDTQRIPVYYLPNENRDTNHTPGLVASGQTFDGGFTMYSPFRSLKYTEGVNLCDLTFYDVTSSQVIESDRLFQSSYGGILERLAIEDHCRALRAADSTLGEIEVRVARVYAQHYPDLATFSHGATHLVRSGSETGHFVIARQGSADGDRLVWEDTANGNPLMRAGATRVRMTDAGAGNSRDTGEGMYLIAYRLGGDGSTNDVEYGATNADPAIRHIGTSITWDRGGNTPANVPETLTSADAQAMRVAGFVADGSNAEIDLTGTTREYDGSGTDVESDGIFLRAQNAGIGEIYYTDVLSTQAQDFTNHGLATEIINRAAVGGGSPTELGFRFLIEQIFGTTL